MRVNCPRPIGAVLRRPAIMDHLDRRGVEIKPSDPAVLFRNDQVSFLQHSKMLHHCNARYVKIACKRADADSRLFFYDVEHASTAFMSERLKNGVHILVIYHM